MHAERCKQIKDLSYMYVVFSAATSPPPSCLASLLFLALTKQKHEQQGQRNKSFMPTICLPMMNYVWRTMQLAAI
jgi:hypothetical protein